MGRHSRKTQRRTWAKRALTATGHLPQILAFASVAFLASFLLTLAIGLPLSESSMLAFITARLFGTLCAVIYLDAQEH